LRLSNNRTECAHDHDYERFAPQDPMGNLDPERGITEFVVGTGGRDLYEWPVNSDEVFIPKKTA
jgi:hypothetical protein